MFVRNLHQGQKFRIINSKIYSKNNEYIYIGIQDYKVYLVMTNVWDRRFTTTSLDMSVLDEECELLDKTEEQPHADKETYIQRQRAWVEETGVKVGDSVRIVRSAQEYEDGWDAIWNTEMDKMVGGEYTVVEIDLKHAGGLYVGGWYLPYFVLEKVETKYKPFTYDDRAQFMGHLVEHKTEQYSVYLASCTPHNVNGYTYQWLLDNFVWADGPDKGKPVGVQSRR